MRLSELLTPAGIRVPLHATDKAGVLRELVALAAPGNGGTSDEVLGAILEREKPVPYETIDGEPVRLFFLLAGPESAAGAHVKALSRISRLVRREPVRGKLLGARTPDEFYRVLCEAEGP